MEKYKDLFNLCLCVSLSIGYLLLAALSVGYFWLAIKLIKLLLDA
jgi:hypothetical protein